MKIENLCKICAVVVFYNPDHALSNISKITHQVSRCFIIDNSERKLEHSDILAIENVEYFWMGGNKGIAAAQNLGIARAIEMEMDYVIFFDQDSEVPNNMILQLLKSYKSLEGLGYRVGLVGPRACNKNTGEPYTRKDKLAKKNFKAISNRYTPVDYTLSSGSLSALRVFEVTGVMDSSLFIDSVDHEYCWRLCSKGYQVFIDEDVLMPHMLGARQLSFFGVKVNVPSPIRHYYVFRNWCLLLRIPHVPVKFKIRTVLLMLPKATFFSLFVPPRFTRLHYIIRGLIDGVLDKSGKLQ